ncbi:hypothetical protein ABPG73_003525 [Tetrahymena malaccensis]
MEITFLRIDVRSDASNIYIVVEKVNEKERPYLIKNYSRHFKIKQKKTQYHPSCLQKSDNYSNPAGLFQNITTDVNNLLNKPTKPLEGAQRGGDKDLLKVSGFLDAVSFVVNSIKNTITYRDDKANQKRLRYPRVIYGREGFYKKFIDLDAGMKLTLQLVSKGKLRNSDFHQTFLIQFDENKKKIMYWYFEIIVLFDETKKKKKLYFSTSDLAEIELEQFAHLRFSWVKRENRSVRQMKKINNQF